MTTATASRARRNGTAATPVHDPVDALKAALKPMSDDERAALLADVSDGVARRIPLHRLRPDPTNIRGSVGDITELTASVKAQGVLEPLLVVIDPDDKAGFLIVCGHRRYAAATAAKSIDVLCVIRTLDERGRLEAQLTENLQRSDLTPLEEARAFARAVELGASQRQLSARLGPSQSHISKRLALLKLPDKHQHMVDVGELYIDDAVQLARLADHPAHIKAALDYAHNYRRDMKTSVDRELEEVARFAVREESIAKLEKAGVRLLDYPSYWGQSKCRPLGKTHGYYGEQWCTDPVPTARKTIEANGHLAAVVSRKGDIVYVCTDPAPYLKAGPGGPVGTRAELDAAAAKEAEAERRRKERLRLKKVEGRARRAHVAAWLAQIDGRGRLHAVLDDADVGDARGLRESIDILLASCTPSYVSAPQERIACELLGIDRTDSGLRRHAAKGNQWAVALAVSIAAMEVSIDNEQAGVAAVGNGLYGDLLATLDYDNPKPTRGRARRS